MKWAIYHNCSRCSKIFSVKKEAQDRLRQILEDKKTKKGITIREGLDSFVAVESGYDEKAGEIILTTDLYEISPVY